LNKKTEIEIYELAFGINARPRHLNNLPKDVKRPFFTEADLIDKLKEFEKYAFKWQEQEDLF